MSKSVEARANRNLAEKDGLKSGPAKCEGTKGCIVELIVLQTNIKSMLFVRRKDILLFYKINLRRKLRKWKII